MAAAGATLLAGKLPAQSPRAVAQPSNIRFSARLEQGYSGNILAAFSGMTAFVQAIAYYRFIGRELVALDVYQSGSATYYIGSWVLGGLPSEFFYASDWATFNSHFNLRQSQGMGLLDFNVVQIQGVTQYSGIWNYTPGTQEIIGNLTAGGVSLVYKESQHPVQPGVAPKAVIRVQGQVTDQARYTLLIEDVPLSGNGFLPTGWADFVDYFNGDQGRNSLLSLDITPYKGQYLTTAFYLPGSDPIVILGKDWNTFQAEVVALQAAGYYVRTIETCQIPDSWSSAFRHAFDGTAVGYAFGISTGDSMSLAAHGYAVKPDLPATNGLRMNQGSSLTLGSVSKFIDAVALLHVLESNSQYTLSSKFLPIIEALLPDGTHLGGGMGDVSLLNLLTHTAGLDDPGGANYDGVLRDYMALYVAQNFNPLKLNPSGQIGTVVSYSNAAYQVIRGVVWAMSGASSYHDYVDSHILGPLEMGQTSMPQPPSTSPTLYYNRSHGPDAGQIIGTDASWDSSPEDMLKLMNALRGNSLLSARSLAQLFQFHTFAYQFSNGARYASPSRVAPGFDPVSVSSISTPLPTVWTKSGGYTDQAQSRILRSNSPAIDVVLQTNTDTETNPVSHSSDGLSVSTEKVMLDTFYLLYR